MAQTTLARLTLLGSAATTTHGGHAVSLAVVNEDPYYEHGPAAFVRELLHGFRMRLIVDDELEGDVAVDPSRGNIWLPSGLDWPDAHPRIDRAFLRCVKPDWAPEFRRAARGLRLVSSNDVVAPTLRRPW